MRGRTQAVVVALLGSWLPLISAATVALVTLRRGAQEGMLVLLWACMPAMLGLFDTNMGPLMAIVTLAGYIAITGVALIQRYQQSWAVSLMVMVALSCASSLLTTQFTDPVADIQNALGGMLEQAPEPEKAALGQLRATFVLGFIAFAMAANGIASLFLARWWQAMLYNPGGFQVEFHSLKLPLVPALTCFAGSMYCWAQDGNYLFWAFAFSLPLVMVTLAIAHSVVKQKQAGTFWLVLVYIALLVFTGPVTLFCAGIAVLDTWMNFRSRLTQRPPEA